MTKLNGNLRLSWKNVFLDFQGDSGGPLIVEREDKRYELIGM